MKEAVLTLLMQNEGKYVSGETISRELGVTRTAVWKDVAALRREGFVIDAVNRLGYRLSGGPDRLMRSAVLPLLERDHGDGLICLESVDSTNNYAKTLSAVPGQERVYIFAGEQTGGRGRRGRSFYSPAGLGLYLTGLYRPKSLPPFLSNFTAYVAVAVCLAIEHTCGLRTAIKWPNDILYEGRKLCGILTELAVEGESGAVEYLITGMGVNVGQQEEDFPEEIRDTAGSLLMACGTKPPLSSLCAALINELDRAYDAFLRTDETYRELYRERCDTLGRPIYILSGDLKTPAFAEDLAGDFGLMVSYEDGRRETIYAGEVSVRTQD